MTRKARFVMLAVVASTIAVAAFAFYRPFPPDHSPEGAYARIAKAIAEEHPRDMFAYLEQDAQDAAFSIRDMRRETCDWIERAYPPGVDRDTLLAAYGPQANAVDATDEFLLMGKRRGFIARLRTDLSGVGHVEIVGERATVVTARGTRYSFRRRPNGMWGLTMFTAELLAESERAARDLASVRAAAEDYTRAAPATAQARDR
jgi:hypothetical protein